MTASNSVVLIYVPCGSVDEATTLARALLDEHLIACANIHQTRSIYRWEGNVVDEPEQVLICKTTLSSAPEAARRAEELHSYQVPCILQIQPAQASEAYAAWVAGEVSEGEKALDRGL